MCIPLLLLLSFAYVTNAELSWSSEGRTDARVCCDIRAGRGWFLRVDLRMPTVWLAEPLYEEALLGRQPRGGESLRRRVLELQWLFGYQAADGDVVICDEEPDCGDLCAFFPKVRWVSAGRASHELRRLGSAERAAWSLEPWVWSARAIEFAHASGLEIPLRLPDISRSINSRQFAPGERLFPLHRDETVPTFPVRICRSLSDVREALDCLMDHSITRWVIKAEFGHSGRNQLRGDGLQLRTEQVGWLQRLFTAECVAVVEPWLEPICEYGVQWSVAAGGKPAGISLDGIAGLLTDSQGGYLGSVVFPEHETGLWWDVVRPVQQEVLLRVSAAGYHGRIGIDCMVASWKGIVVVRPIQDLNGRHTMGRTALAIAGRLSRDRHSAWYHFSTKRQRAKILSIVASMQCVEVLETGPVVNDGTPGSMLVSLIVPEAEQDWKRLIGSSGVFG